MAVLSTASPETLHTVLDYLRYGLSRAQDAGLYFGHGTDNAWDDIRTLVLRSLGLPYDCDPILWSGRLTHEEKGYLDTQLTRRIEGRVPVPYLIGEAWFCGMPFTVDERVLIPRSPIGEWIERCFSPFIREERVLDILDLCTGSGCIAIACCHAFPQAHVDAADISPEALEVAAINRESHGCADQLSLFQSDCWEHVPPKQYDIIVSNPPYVGEAEMQTLPPEYHSEPVLALECANNGLAILQSLILHARDYLRPEGILVLEAGNSEEALCEAFPELPFTWLDCERGGHGICLLTREQLDQFLGD